MFATCRWIVMSFFRLSIALALAGVLVGTSTMSPATVTAQPTPAPTSVWISDTGQTMTGAFLDYWLEHPQIGNPVSGAVIHNDLWTQWFENARLELDPGPFEYQTITNVHRHQIGRSFANRSGYSESLVAFRPLTEGPDRFFPQTGHTLTMGFRSFYEQPGIGEQVGFPISEEFDIGTLTYQFFEYGAFVWGPDPVAQLLPLGQLDAGIHGHLGKWQSQPWDALDWESTELDMLAFSYRLPGERTIEIDLSDFLLTARVGDKVVLESVVSTGHVNAPTVPGHHSIYLKYEIQSLSGIGWDGNPYSAPNTPWVMYFYQDYAIHSSLTRSTYGNMDSQGCVVPPMDVSEALWHWADYGTAVWVHE